MEAVGVLSKTLYRSRANRPRADMLLLWKGPSAISHNTRVLLAYRVDEIAELERDVGLMAIEILGHV